MVSNRVKNLAKRILKSNRFTRQMVYKVRSRKLKKEFEKGFNDRISRVDPTRFLGNPEKPDLNIVFVVVDCLRFSNLSFTGYHRETTPFMDTLKAKFRGVSAAPWTYPSVASMMTGLYPSVHNADFKTELRYFNAENIVNLKPLRENIVSLPEVLYFLGYDIYFSSTIYVARHALRNRVVPLLYFDKPPAGKVLEDHKKFLEKARRPFFFYLHLGDLHVPIDIPGKFKDFFGEVKKLKNINTWAFVNYKEQKGKAFEEYKENRILLYDNALRYVDHVLEDFYNYLDSKGVLDETLFIITADHGEGLWDHSKEEAENFYTPRGYHGIDHGQNLFREMIEVPILLDGGAVDKSGVFTDRLVSTVDIMPTILDLTGVEHRLPMNGLNVFEAYSRKGRAILSEAIAYGYEKKALIKDGKKLIYAPKDGVVWLLDMDKDPEERNPLSDNSSVAPFVSELKRFLLKSKTKIVKSKLAKK